MQTKFVEANGLRFEVLEEGSGDRLALCLHGFPEHAISWRHQIPVLAGMGYRVWAVNQRGYGRTTRPTQVADYALAHLVDDVTALINVAGAKNVLHYCDSTMGSAFRATGQLATRGALVTANWRDGHGAASSYVWEWPGLQEISVKERLTGR